MTIRPCRYCGKEVAGNPTRIYLSGSISKDVDFKVHFCGLVCLKKWINSRNSLIQEVDKEKIK
jgi:hypothetical protein